MLQFIRKQRVQAPQNVRIVCGDLNIGALPPGAGSKSPADRSANYKNFAELMSNEGFIDAWNIWNGPSVERCTHTGIDFEPRKVTCTFAVDQKLCQVFESGGAQHNANGQCYDLLFVERPAKVHGFRLDVSRVRRRHFMRAKANKEVGYMSDHLGLDATFIASPKA